MDIGKLKNNATYYDGYEGEGEITLSIDDSPEIFLRIWDGYFEDIFGKPITSDCGWSGFTKDYQELCNTFDVSDEPVTIDPEIYLKDLYLYKGQAFSYEETSPCLDLLIALFEYANVSRLKVKVFVS